MRPQSVRTLRRQSFSAVDHTPDDGVCCHSTTEKCFAAAVTNLIVSVVLVEKVKSHELIRCVSPCLVHGARRLLHCLMPCSSYCPRVLCMPACCGRISCSSFVLAGSTCCHLVRGPLLLDLRSALSCVRYRGLLGVRCLICLRLSVSVGRLDLDFVKEIGECEHSKSKIFLASRGGASRPARPRLKSGPP